MNEAEPGEADTTTIDSYATKASSGTLWTILGFGGKQMLRLGSNLILTRLLMPEHFGLMALIMVYFVGLELFSDIGIGPAIIQNRRSDPAFLRTAWTIQVTRGATLWIIALLAAPYYAAYCEEPFLVDLIYVTAFSALIDGFQSANYHVQHRNLDLKRFILLEIYAQIAGIVVMLVWASQSRTVWALVAGLLVQSTSTVVLGHFWLKGDRMRFHFDKVAASSLFSFGVWVFISTMLTFCSDHLDKIIVKKYGDLEQLGVYTFAVTLATLPTEVTGRVAHTVLFSLFSRIYNADPDRLYRSFPKLREPILIVGGWMAAGLIAGGTTIFRLLFDPRYWGGGPMLQAVVVGLWFGAVMQGPLKAAVLAQGRTAWTASFALVKLIGMVIFIPLGFRYGGFIGGLVGLAASEIGRYAITRFAALIGGVGGRFEELKFTAIIAASSIPVWLSVEYLNDHRPDWFSSLSAASADRLWAINQSVLIFVLITAMWWPWLKPLFGKIRRKEQIFELAEEL